MAENLDDFFAKKDKKKKGKSKSKKFTTTNELVKTLETEETESSDKAQAQQEKTSTERTKDDEEWTDFDSGERDLTGLKIQSLSIGDESKDTRTHSSATNEHVSRNSDGDYSEFKDFAQQQGKGGKVWRHEAGSMVQEEPPPPPEEPPTAPGPPAGSYVPPHQRSGAGGGGGGGRLAHGRAGGYGRKVIPDINSMAAFPTLGQESGLGSDRRGPSAPVHDYQTVRGSGVSRQREVARESIEHRNKYEALQSP